MAGGTPGRDTSYRYPMYVVPSRSVMRMQLMEPQELLQDVLVERTEHTGAVIFVSHPWLARLHPDPRGMQLNALKRIVRAMARGELSVPPQWALEAWDMAEETMRPQEFQTLCSNPSRARGAPEEKDRLALWIDFCCAPTTMPHDGHQSARAVQCKIEESRRLAIASIPRYLEEVDMLLCLGVHARAEDGQPRDFRAFRHRTWCEAEKLMYFLATKVEDKKIIVAESGSNVYYVRPTDWMQSSPCLLRLSVVEDRPLVGDALAQALQSRTMEALRQVDLVAYRSLTVLRSQLLKGSRHSEELAHEGLDSWLSILHFTERHPNADSLHGWTPLRFAIHANRCDLAEALLRGAAVEAPLNLSDASRDWAGALTTGATLLHSACFVHEQPKIVERLLMANANPSVRDKAAWTPALLAAHAGHIGNLSTLVEHCPRAAESADRWGRPPGQILIGRGHLSALKVWFSTHADKSTERTVESEYPSGMGVLQAAVMDLSSPEMEAFLLGLRYNINKPASAAPAHAFSGKGTFFADALTSWEGMTPLMGAALVGNLFAVERLLRVRASVHVPGRRGRTALMLAAGRGHSEVVQLLLGARAQIDSLDIWGFSALSLAQERKHNDVASVLMRNVITTERKSTSSWFFGCFTTAECEGSQCERVAGNECYLPDVSVPLSHLSADCCMDGSMRDMRAPSASGAAALTLGGRRCAPQLVTDDVFHVAESRVVDGRHGRYSHSVSSERESQ